MSTWQRILLVGVGGQGVMSAGRWVGEAAAACGLPVVVRQVHGLSQRGGSVQTSVVVGGARCPEIPDGMADVVVGLEPMEAARAVAKISARTTAMVNTRAIVPASLQSAGRPYPPIAALLGPVEERAGALVTVDATALAEAAGSHRCLNVVMLGLLAGSGLVRFPAERLLEVVVGTGLAAFREVNRRAFELGMHAVETDGCGVHSGTGGEVGER